MDAHIEFTTGPILVPESLATSCDVGAQVEFRGIVRGTEEGRAIVGLRYEAHVEMAERQVRRIMDELAVSWPCRGVLFIHRLGLVPVGEASLYVRAQSQHREAAFRFCMELIDLMKRDVPIWKRGEDGGGGVLSAD
jgi:molybdopterin synthase catalytic subunit